MARILILGSRSAERQGLVLFMELVGHECIEADSLQDALNLLAKDSVDLVLADAELSDMAGEQIVRPLKKAAPAATVMMLADEASPAAGMDDVITSPLTSVQNISPQYPPVRKGEAFLLLLPEQDSLKMLPDLPQTPGLLNKLGLLHQSQQKFKAAEQLYQRALELSEAAVPGQGRETASILMNLAGLYHEQQRYAEAARLYQRSLQFAEKAYGPNHPKVARRLRRLTEIYRVLGNEKEAAPIHERLKQMG
ncbi:MAG: tetratricopeptide repeat protein [Acidobacteria bacterium]|nr:tetratricopeptide repeat protein [Acidobacteriota bacterium]